MLPLIIRIIYSALEINDIRTAIITLLKLYSKNQSLKLVLDSENVSEEELDQPYSNFNPNIIKKLLSIMKPSELTELKTQLDKLLFKPIKKVNNLFKEDNKDINGKDIEQDNKDDKG
ncbi:MAG: hypothetical protein O7C58_02440 [Rickettsia endosymbiont of Ixodes persulcatus]|nr:hypothetical protein [Rickettsia endosymbiont of Ixodes persulcatus]